MAIDDFLVKSEGRQDEDAKALDSWMKVQRKRIKNFLLLGALGLAGVFGGFHLFRTQSMQQRINLGNLSNQAEYSSSVSNHVRSSILEYGALKFDAYANGQKLSLLEDKAPSIDLHGKDNVDLRLEAHINRNKVTEKVFSDYYADLSFNVGYMIDKGKEVTSFGGKSSKTYHDNDCIRISLNETVDLKEVRGEYKSIFKDRNYYEIAGVLAFTPKKRPSQGPSKYDKTFERNEMITKIFRGLDRMGLNNKRLKGFLWNHLRYEVSQEDFWRDITSSNGNVYFFRKGEAYSLLGGK